MQTATAARALEAHRAKVNCGGSGGNHHVATLTNTLETSYVQLDDQFARLEAEPDIAKRRELSLELTQAVWKRFSYRITAGKRA